MKKNLIIALIVLLIGAGSFYGGIKYSESKGPSNSIARGNFQNLSAEERQKMLENAGANAGAGFRQRGQTGAGFLNGEVIAKDAQSLTVKMQDGSSKIIFYSNSTKISKSVDGLIGDVNIGARVMVNGQQNSDGSYTAQTIQIPGALLEPKKQ